MTQVWWKTAKLILKWINRSGSIRLYFILFPLLLFFDASTEPSESAEGPGGAAGPAGGPPEADGGWDPGRSSSSRFKFTVLMSCPWCVSVTCVYWTNVYGFNYLICVPPRTPLQGGSLLTSPFLKGFLAGYIVARLRSSALLGVAVGTCTGIYAAQNYAVPNIENTVKDYISNLKNRRKSD